MTIKQIQSLLTYLGYEPGTVDGLAGPKTAAALLAFQSQEGLEADGKPGPLTEAALIDAVKDGRMKQPVSAAESGTPGSFWSEIRYFAREEFRCHCGGKYCNGFPAEPAEQLIRVAERLREHFDAPVTVSSGLRCQTHNDAQPGSVPNSLHIVGHAMDFAVRGKSAAQVLPWVQAQPEIRYAYAINSSYIHMDIGR